MFTSEEQNLISRYSIHKGWDTKDWDLTGLNATELAAKKLDAAEVEKIKNKIRSYYIGLSTVCCCYCRRSMHQWDKLDIDTEHVLPKGRFPQWTFKIVNLNIACKRCNMRLKKEDYSFFKGAVTECDPFKSELYTFLHPNLDDPSISLVPVVVQIGVGLLIKYYLAESGGKAKATYDYFRLKEIEVDAINSAQGFDLQELSEKLPAPLAKAVEALLGEHSRI